MDRVYLSSPNVIAVLDHERKRTFVIRKEGLPDVGKLPFACVRSCACFKVEEIYYLVLTVSYSQF